MRIEHGQCKTRNNKTRPCRFLAHSLSVDFVNPLVAFPSRSGMVATSVAHAVRALKVAEQSLAKVDLERLKALVRLRTAKTNLRQAYKQQILGKSTQSFKKQKETGNKDKQVGKKQATKGQKKRRYTKTPPGWCPACWYRHQNLPGGQPHLYWPPCLLKGSSA